MADTLPTVQCLLEEYKALKTEQTARIGFRDNLLYVTVAGVGAVSAFALGKDGTPYAFLVSPWLAVVLGWTYLVNDEKISSVGRHVRLVLGPRLESMVGQAGETYFLWERAHRSDANRFQRKVFQLLVDLITFIGSALASIAVFLARVKVFQAGTVAIVSLEVLCCLLLAWQIIKYADLEKSLAVSTPPSSNSAP